MSLVGVMLAFSLGLLGFLVPALLGPMLPVGTRQTIGRWYYARGMRILERGVIVWRLLGGPELRTFELDDETQQAVVTLSSGTLSDDKQLPFADPDDRIHRLAKKPLAVVPEPLPAAVDAELSEIGYWANRHKDEHGVEKDGKVNPWVRVGQGLRAANPLHAMNLPGHSVEPQNINSTEELTKERFAEYGSRVSVQEAAGMLAGFAGAAGVVVGAVYVRRNVIGDGGAAAGGGPTLPIPPGSLDVQLQAVDIGLQALGGIPL